MRTRKDISALPPRPVSQYTIQYSHFTATLIKESDDQWDIDY